MPRRDDMKPFTFAWLAIASALGGVVVLEAARPQYGGTLRVETQAAIRSIDPAAEAADHREASLARRLQPLVFETLVGVAADGGLRPLLASSWESDARATRWRFRIRPGVMMHDGNAMEPWHVAAALRAAADAFTASVDGDAVVIESTAPRPDLPWELADPRMAIAVRRSPDHLAGTGPYRVERLEAGAVSLRAHDAYWGGRPFADGVRV